MEVKQNFDMAPYQGVSKLLFSRNIYYRSVLAATLAGWFLGALWYSPLAFGNIWLASEANLDATSLEFALLGPSLSLLVAPIVSIFTGFVTAYVIHGISVFCGLHGMREGFILSLWLGLGLIVINMLAGYLFINTTWQAALVDAGYMYLRILICCILACIWYKRI